MTGQLLEISVQTDRRYNDNLFNRASEPFIPQPLHLE